MRRASAGCARPSARSSRRAQHDCLRRAGRRAPLIGPGALVCVDDYGFGEAGGKGMILDMFFSTVRAEVAYSGYQKVWRVA